MMLLRNGNPDQHVEMVKALASIDKICATEAVSGLHFFLALRSFSPRHHHPSKNSSSKLALSESSRLAGRTSHTFPGCRLTQRILLNLICNLVIRSCGVFSDFAYPEYIVDMLLKLVGKMVDRHGNAHP
jgi:hypothetical protein